MSQDKEREAFEALKDLMHTIHIGFAIKSTQEVRARKAIRTLESALEQARAALASQQADAAPLSIARMACLIDEEARYAYQEIQRLVKTIKYMLGIAERGRGIKCPAEESPEKFLLDYVKELEASQQAGNGEPSDGELNKLAEAHTWWNGSHAITNYPAFARDAIARWGASPPSREPLTEEQQAQIAEDWATDRLPDIASVIRAVERAHGIHSREGGSK